MIPAISIHAPRLVSLDDWDRMSDDQKEDALRFGAYLSREDLQRLAARLASQEAA